VLLKVVASLLVVALGLFITLIGAFFLAFTESNLNANIVPSLSGCISAPY
jgi:hypothetical protein